MSVTTVEYLRTAILEALTTDRTGTHTRAIPAAYLFNEGMPPGFDPSLRSVRALEKPGVFVAVTKIVPWSGVADELGSDHGYDLEIVLSRDYWLGYEHSSAEISTQFNRVTDDFARLRDALCYPAALDTTAAGNATGIGGNALRPIEGAPQSAISFERIDGQTRLLNARDAFTCSILYTATAGVLSAPALDPAGSAPSVSIASAAAAIPGNTLAASLGNWLYDTVPLTWVWLRDGAEIADSADDCAYTLLLADIGSDIGIQVTARGPGGVTAELSNTITVVAA